jgi:N-acetylmuramoyl-L-alanine amidase
MVVPGDYFQSALHRVLLIAALLVGGVHLSPAQIRSGGSGYPELRMFGNSYVDAHVFAARHGLAVEWADPGRELRLRSRWTTIEFAANGIELWLNGLRLFLSLPVVARDGRLYLGATDVEKTLNPILSPKFPGAVPRLKVIAIDAGHGGNDPGNQNQRLKLQEKTFTLDVAKRLERLLKTQGFRVVMTRTRDRAVALEQRTEIARRASADLFVSIHFNSFANASVAGAETYVMSPQGQRSSPQAEGDRNMMATAYPSNRHDLASILLGYNVHRRTVGVLNAFDRGLKHFRYSVLRTAECPAVLVEAAFLSNTAEGRKVATPAYRQKIAEGIASGIAGYAATLERLRAAKG